MDSGDGVCEEMTIFEVYALLILFIIGLMVMVIAGQLTYVLDALEALK